MAEVTLQDALEYCLADPDGLGVEGLLAKFPQYRAELEPLLALSSRIVTIAPPPVPAERRAAMKARLMEAAAAQAPSERPTQRVVAQGEKKPSWVWAVLRRPAFVAGSLATLFVAVMWWGAASALPDSPFYNIKLASENIMVNFAGGAAEKARAHLGLANARLDEMVRMNSQGKLAGAAGAIENYDQHMKECATLWKQTSGKVSEDIKAGISASVSRCDATFKGFGGSVGTLPDSVKEDVQKLYANLSGIRAEIGEQPGMELPEGITGTVALNPTPVAGATASSTAPVRRESATVEPGATPGSTRTVPVEPAGTPEASATASPTVAPGGGTPPIAGTPSPGASAGVAGRTSTPAGAGTATVRPQRTATAINTPVGINTPLATIVPSLPSATPVTGGVPTVAVPVVPTATLTATSQPTVDVPPTLFVDIRPTTTAVAAEVTPSITISVPPTASMPTATFEPPRGTPVPPTPDVEPTAAACALRMRELEVESCESDEDVSWSVEIENASNRLERGSWEATLLVKRRNGPFEEVEGMSGDVTIQAHGSRSIEESFNYELPSDAKGVRVIVTLSTEGASCDTERAKEADCDE